MAQEYADRPVVFIEYDVDHAPDERYGHWWMAHGGGGSVILPLVMTDSGNQISHGYVDFENTYRQMVDASLARPPEAEIQASWWRSGNRIELLVRVKNLRPQTLVQSYVMGIVYEENRINVTNRFGRDVVGTSVNDLFPNETENVRLTSDDLTGVDWNKLHIVVFVEEYQQDRGHYDMLQAAPAQQVEPSLLVVPEYLAFMIDSGDAAGPTAAVQVLGSGYAAWTATPDRPWLSIAPTNGNLLDRPQVAIDKGALEPGWQEGTVTFKATDAAFTDTVVVRAYLGEVERVYLPATIR